MLSLLFYKLSIDNTKLSRKLLMVILVMSCSSTYADWTLVDKTTSGEPITFYVDEKTIKSRVEQRQALVKATALSDYSIPQNVNGDIHKSRIFPREYNCTTKSFRDLGITVYSENMGRGRVIFSEKNPQLWEKIISNSPMEKEINMVCNQGKAVTTGQLFCEIPTVGKINVKFNINTNEVMHEGAQETYDRVVTNNKITYSLPTPSAKVRFDIDLNTKIIEARIINGNNILDMKKGTCNK